MFLSACLSVSVCLFLSLIRCLAGGRVPARGGGGRGGLGLGQPWTLVLALITAGFLQGQDWVMVSLLPPQSDVTLPGPARLEGEPQGDFMQAPGLPGSPAPQNVSTWPWPGLRPRPEGRTTAGGPSPPTPWDLPASVLCFLPANKYPGTPRSRSVETWASACPFGLGLSQGRAVRPSY